MDYWSINSISIIHSFINNLIIVSILYHCNSLIYSSFLLSFGSILFPPMGFFLFMYLWERSYTTEVGSEYAKKCTERARERWIFVNGMCVDNNLGNGNATQLSKLFNRQVYYCYYWRGEGRERN